MARARTVIVCGVCLFAATPAAWSACRFQNDEIVNPFEAGCGDVMLTYTESDNTGTNIALGYPVPIPDRFADARRRLPHLRQPVRAPPIAADMHDEVAGQIVGQTVAGRDIWAYRARRCRHADRGGLCRGRGAGQRRHSRARMADAGSGDRADRGDDRRQGGRRLRAVPRSRISRPCSAGEQRRRFPADPAVRRSHDRGSRAAARRADAAQEHAQPADPGRDRRGPGDGRRQLLGHRPQPQFAPMVLRKAGPAAAAERDQPHLSRDIARHRARDRSAAVRGDACAGGAAAALQRHALLWPGLLRPDHRQRATQQHHRAACRADARRLDARLWLRSGSRWFAGDRHHRRLLRFYAFGAELDLGARAGERRTGLRRPRDARPQRLRAARRRGGADARGRRADVPARLLSPGRASRGARRADPRSGQRPGRLRRPRGSRLPPSRAH